MVTINEVRSELCKRSFYYFVRYFWDTIIPDEPRYNWHIKYLCEELQQSALLVKDRKPKENDIIINIPPGTTKSTICTIMFPVWCWVIDPTMKFITGSYSIDLSTEHAVKSRDIIRSDKFKSLFGGISLKVDKDNKTSYENNFTGSRSATSVGGTVTGKHAHIIIIDDPLNPKKSVSDVERNNANEWFDKTLSTRKVDKAVTLTILIMQRLHESDCTAHLLSKDKYYKHICLPAEDCSIVKPTELRKMYVNGLLDPIRLSESNLKEAKTDLGSYGYAGQMMQSPSPIDGGVIKGNYFNVINDIQATWDLFIDSAYTSNKDNDPTALMVCAYIDNQLYIKESVQVWLGFPELIKLIKDKYYYCDKIYIEPKASGLSIVQQLKKDTDFYVQELDAPKGDKLSRVIGVQPFLESKRCTLINGVWNNQFIEECMVFPNGKHDDQVDNLTASINKYHLFSKRRRLLM